ncbi:hypothetical protein D3C76_1291380 [compost metagenome]
MRQRLFFHAKDAGLQRAFVFGGFYIATALVLDGAGQEATGTACWVHDLFVQLWVYHTHHEFGDRARGVEFARVAGVLQVAQ